MQILQSKKSRLLPIYLVFFIDNFGFSLVLTLFAPLLLNPSFGIFDFSLSLGDKNFFLGLLYATFPFAQFIAAPFIGDFADHYGRKKAFFLTMIGGTLGYSICALAVISKSFALLLLGRLLSGFSAGNLGICLASIADVVHTEKMRGRLYGLMAMTAGLSWVSSMIIGSYLGDPSVDPAFNPSLPFFLSAVLCLVTFIFIYLYFHDTRGIKHKPVRFNPLIAVKNIITAFHILEVRFLYLIYFLWIIGWGIVIQWFSGYSIEKFGVPSEEIAWGFVLFGVCWAIGGATLNYILLRKIRSKVVASIGLFLTTALIGLMSVTKDFSQFTLLFVLSAMTAGVVMSNLLNIVSVATPYHLQGKVMSFSQSVIALGWIVGPLISGTIAKIDVNQVFLAATAFCMVSLVLLLIYNQLGTKTHHY
jgi:MFS family permease